MGSSRPTQLLKNYQKSEELVYEILNFEKYIFHENSSAPTMKRKSVSRTSQRPAIFWSHWWIIMKLSTFVRFLAGEIHLSMHEMNPDCWNFIYLTSTYFVFFVKEPRLLRIDILKERCITHWLKGHVENYRKKNE